MNRMTRVPVRERVAGVGGSELKSYALGVFRAIMMEKNFDRMRRKKIFVDEN